MTEKQLQKEIEKRHKLHQLKALEANNSRAQSITVGTAGGGTIEITMRSAGGDFLWNTYQPVEIVELINQLAAGIGCHIHIIPREDFASWRNWQVSEKELAHARGIQHQPAIGFPPFAKSLTNGEYVAGMRENLPEPESQEKEHVATKKAVNKRSTKRRRATAK